VSITVPRMRMFAGPNGSGKSELKKYLRENLLGIYLNPDEIEKEIRHSGFLDLKKYTVITAPTEIIPFLKESNLLKTNDPDFDAQQLKFGEDRLHFGGLTINSYIASVVVDFIRQKLIEARATFTLETVMSHRSKLDLLDKARRSGYRTYLYFIATDDPAINVSRVRFRVKMGGHSVPDEKIITRYYRSLEILMDAIRLTNRAYIFDNSLESPTPQHTWLAEITEGRDVELKTRVFPGWFRSSVLDKISNA
jgi:predicted ABC-type ATPase